MVTLIAIFLQLSVMNAPPDMILNHFYPPNILKTCIPTIHLNVILPSPSQSLKLLFLRGFTRYLPLQSELHAHNVNSYISLL